ncbi:MAG TPA: hypothetical protein VGL65_07250 [Gemmatimonadales bacterium]|jgi:hypothetical protein
MRRSSLLAIPLAAALFALPGCGPGYRTSVGVGADYGTPIDLYGYSPDYWGDWHTDYLGWSPTVVYEANGQYYPRNVRGSRAVQVYHSNKGYFLPPHESTWSDKRFNTRRMPNDGDYGRARPHPDI